MREALGLSGVEPCCDAAPVAAAGHELPVLGMREHDPTLLAADQAVEVVHLVEMEPAFLTAGTNPEVRLVDLVVGKIGRSHQVGGEVGQQGWVGRTLPAA